MTQHQKGKDNGNVDALFRWSQTDGDGTVSTVCATNREDI